jgi:hypothetical protein
LKNLTISPLSSKFSTIISMSLKLLLMSTYIKAEASQPQKKMHECTRCKSAGFPEQMIWFKKVENGYDDKIFWKLMDDNGLEHIHKYKTSPMVKNEVSDQKLRRKRVIDIFTVSDIDEARRLLREGWEYKTSYPATLSNIPHYVLVKRE